MATTKVRGELVGLNPGNPDYILDSTNAVTVINSGGNQYNFNGVYGKFGAKIGTITLTGVPAGHPIAFINNGKTSQISYTGTVDEGTATGPDGNTYTFYSGTVTLTVSADFGTISYYCKIHGYMGGQDNLVYTYSDSGLKMPSGTELNRPTNATGQIRNNTNETSNGATSAMEYYNGTDWKKITTKALLPPTQTYTQNAYGGNGNTRTFNPGFTPDLVMIKTTNYYEDWVLSYRGFGENYLRPSTSQAKVASTILRVDQATGFRTTGVSLVNGSAGYNYIYYAWKANGGTYSSNADGTITSSVQSSAGTAASGSLDQGFSVVRYTGNGTASQTVGHGLDGTPDFIIVKNENLSSNWACYHVGLGVDKVAFLDTGGATQTVAGKWSGTNDSVFGINSAADVNNNGSNLVAFCFKSVLGYSKFSSYTGTGSAGNAQDLGFEPGLVIIRGATSGGWLVYDSSNTGQRLQIDSTVPNSADTSITFTTTGFEFTGSGNNTAATEYIYMAFDKNV